MYEIIIQQLIIKIIMFNVYFYLNLLHDIITGDIHNIIVMTISTHVI